MKQNLYVPVYSITLLMSAVLLFSVQPMFSKMVLPLLGGTSQVWTTSMLFFQVMLLGGYAYAHGTTKFLSIRAQSILHIILLSVFVLALPIIIPAGWEPPKEEDPTFWQLSLMLTTVGGPFFVLSGSAPMLQRWFSNTEHRDADNPYFLYGASNLGSMTALIAYPFVVEPLLNLSEQTEAWKILYITLILATACSAFLIWSSSKAAITNTAKQTNDADHEHITWKRRGLWLILSLVPSSLMLGVTTFITTDIASAPLFWVVPLALYVGTFIIAFARKPILSKKTVLNLQALLLIIMIVQMMVIEIQPIQMITLHIVTFFFCALALHMELADSKPTTSNLTEFYLIMSIGGALGGFFNAIIAPNIFVVTLEYAIGLGAVVMLRHANDPEQKLIPTFKNFAQQCKTRGLDPFFKVYNMFVGLAVVGALFAFLFPSQTVQYISAAMILLSLAFLIDKRWQFAAAVCLVLFFSPPGYKWGVKALENVLYQTRNFYGTIKVIDTAWGERILLHGTTNHGAQPIAEDIRLVPLSYYSEYSPLREVLRYYDTSQGEQNFAVVGLGIGVTSCFAKEGRHYDFFEIDPAVVEIALKPEYFTYLKDCGSKFSVILGDGRLTMNEQPDQLYDLVIIDVYSSDNIPVHLLTKEAIDIYLKKLKPEGILVFHISNKHLDIEPVLMEAGKHFNVPTYAKLLKGGPIAGTPFKAYASHFVVMLKSDTPKSYFIENKWEPALPRKGVHLWTDQYSNILNVLSNLTAHKRVEDINIRERAAKEQKKQEN